MKQTTDPPPAPRSERRSDTDRWNNRSLKGTDAEDGPPDQATHRTERAN
ncbi:MAG: hypothetical protein OXI63_16050 [Candidatus Poribacteria bacterium]|nr:hypothetical protein [Candidatus Poribacteria bacterium]